MRLIAIAIVLGAGLAMLPAKERWIEEGLLGICECGARRCAPPSKSPPRMGGDFQISLLAGFGLRDCVALGFLRAQE